MNGYSQYSHFRKYFSLHSMKKAGAALVRTITSFNNSQIPLFSVGESVCGPLSIDNHTTYFTLIIIETWLGSVLKTWLAHYIHQDKIWRSRHRFWIWGRYCSQPLCKGGKIRVCVGKRKGVVTWWFPRDLRPCRTTSTSNFWWETDDIW